MCSMNYNIKLFHKDLVSGVTIEGLTYLNVIKHLTELKNKHKLHFNENSMHIHKFMNYKEFDIIMKRLKSNSIISQYAINKYIDIDQVVYDALIDSEHLFNITVEFPINNVRSYFIHTEFDYKVKEIRIIICDIVIYNSNL